MATAIVKSAETLADLVERLGNVTLERIQLHPFPGTATVKDVIRLSDGEPKRLCELIDGTLVEKATGHPESRLAARLLFLIQQFLDVHDLGIVTGPDGPHQILDDQVRFPDVAFIAYDRIPAEADPTMAVPNWTPSLAVEILSPSNTKNEMNRKLQNYFQAGVELVWYADPADRTIRVYRSPDDVVILTDRDLLDGEHVLPGFQLSIGNWFDRGLRIHRREE